MNDPAQVAPYFRLQRQPWLALAVVVIANCGINGASVWLDKEISLNWLKLIVLGMMAMGPMLYGTWTALGSGFLLMRLPLVVLSLALSIASLTLAEASIDQLQRHGFITLLSVELAIYLITTSVLLVVRSLRGLRIDEQQRHFRRAAHFQFSIGYLLILMTVAAVALVFLGKIRFSEPQRQFFTFGPRFFIEIMAFGSAYCFLALLPVLAIAIAMLGTIRSKRSMRILWGALLTTSTILVMVVIVMSNEWSWDSLAALLVQLGGGGFAAFAVWMLRRAGYRLCARSIGQNIAG